MTTGGLNRPDGTPGLSNVLILSAMDRTGLVDNNKNSSNFLLHSLLFHLENLTNGQIITSIHVERMTHYRYSRYLCQMETQCMAVPPW